MKFKRNIFKSILLTVLIGSFFASIAHVAAAEGDVQWARTTVETPSGYTSSFTSIATDSSNNVYAVGFHGGNGVFDFGNSVTVSGGYAGGDNAHIVKYNSSGVAQWAKSLTTAPHKSQFLQVAVNTTGEIYAVGFIRGGGVFNFGDSVTVSTGGEIWYENIVIVKYNSSGVTQWAKTIVSASSSSQFQGVATDTSGNIYAVGYIKNTAAFDFGNDVSVTGQYDQNVLIAKYNSAGMIQWAKTTEVGPSASEFKDVVVDSMGNVFVVGIILGQHEFDFGNDITVIGGYDSGDNALIIKYSPSGIAQWAKSTETATNDSVYNGIAVDSSDNIYAVGNIVRAGEFNFGNSVLVAGAYVGNNIVITKYNSSGTTQWAKSSESASNKSVFYGVTVDSSDNIYTVGNLYSNGELNFGNGVTVTGGASANNNFVMVKYDANGLALRARSTVTASNESTFKDVVSDTLGNIYAVGYLNENLAPTLFSHLQADYDFDLGNGVIVSVGDSTSSILVRYQGAYVPTPTPTATPTPTPSPITPASLNSVYFTFGRLRYNKYATPYSLRWGDYAFLKNFDSSKLKLLQIFLYDFEKKGNQGYTKKWINPTTVLLKTNYYLPLNKKYAYVMKFQDRDTGVVATKYFVFYTSKTWLGKSVL